MEVCSPHLVFKLINMHYDQCVYNKIFTPICSSLPFFRKKVSGKDSSLSKVLVYSLDEWGSVPDRPGISLSSSVCPD
jgi:hypothetical protein